MSTVDLQVASAAVDEDVSDVQLLNDRLAGPPTGAVDSARMLCGGLDSDNWPTLSPLETALHRRWTSQHQGYAALQRPVDYKADLYKTQEEGILIPGAVCSFTTKETRDVIVYWSITYSSIRQTGRYAPSTDAEQKLFLDLDGEQIDNAVRYIPVSYGAWARSVSNAGTGTAIAMNNDVNDQVISRGRTWTGHRVLRNIAAGDHHFGVVIWMSGKGTVRIHSAQVWALVRRQ